MKTNRIRCCRECKNALPEGLKASTMFCGVPCKSKFHNRKNLRGAALYDLFMSMRYDRDAAKDENVWTAMCRMAEKWNEQDVQAGVRSFDPPKVALLRAREAGHLPFGRVIYDHTGRSTGKRT